MHLHSIYETDQVRDTQSQMQRRRGGEGAHGCPRRYTQQAALQPSGQVHVRSASKICMARGGGVFHVPWSTLPTKDRIREWCSRIGWQRTVESWIQRAMLASARRKPADFSSRRDSTKQNEYLHDHRCPPCFRQIVDSLWSPRFEPPANQMAENWDKLIIVYRHGQDSWTRKGK